MTLSFTHTARLFLFLCLFTFTSVHASISTFSKAPRVEDLIVEVFADSTLQNALVIFDLDYVLLTPKEKILRPCGEKNGLRKGEFDHLKKLTKDKTHVVDGIEVSEFDYLLSILISSMESELVDPQLIDLIEQLQKNKIPIIVLSNNRSGRIGLVENLTEKKSQELAQWNIHLDHSIFDPTKTISSIDSHSPHFCSGLLFTDGATKGETLKAFFQAQNYYPKSVIFIDDREKMLQSVAEACEELNIEFKGIHFTQLTDQEETCDQKTAHFQFNYLLENKKWLNDNEVIDHLKTDQKILIF